MYNNAGLGISSCLLVLKCSHTFYTNFISERVYNSFDGRHFIDIHNHWVCVCVFSATIHVGNTIYGHSINYKTFPNGHFPVNVCTFVYFRGWPYSLSTYSCVSRIFAVRSAIPIFFHPCFRTYRAVVAAKKCPKGSKLSGNTEQKPLTVLHRKRKKEREKQRNK